MNIEQDKSLESVLREVRRKARIRRIAGVSVAVVLLVVASIGSFLWLRQPKGTDKPSYVTEKVTRGDLVSTISATGTVEALNTVEVGAEISGRILSLQADFNDTVDEGQILAEIDPEQHQAAVAQAKAQMLAAQAQVAEAGATLTESKQEADRSKELAARGLISPKELSAAVARAERAAAALKSAQASDAIARATFDSAKSKLSRTRIMSPIRGTVLSREVEVGQTINAGMQTPVIFIIAEDLSRMRLSSRVDEADIGSVRAGQTGSFTVDAYPGKTFVSTVTSVRNVPRTDQNVVSYEVLLSVDNSELLLKPGMTASVEIVTEKFVDVLLVPNKAMRFSPPKESFAFGMPPGGGMPLLRGKKEAPEDRKDPQDALKALGPMAGNQRILWRLGKEPTSSLVAVKVERIASDGIRTAIRSSEVAVGDAIIVEQADAGRSE